MQQTADGRQIILASGSRARREILAAAGVAFLVERANVDEPALRAEILTAERGMAPARLAQNLASAKAQDVSARHSDAVVIGGDQILALGSEIISKPKNDAAARATLLKLKGRMHELHSAVVIAEKGEVTFSHVATARLAMREFSDAFLEDYLVRVSTDAMQVVGSYQLEGLGVQLFEEIEGDYFTILGLPLLPLLRELRKRQLIMA